MDLDQQPLSGQSWERDPGLLTPALSLDLHSNRRQGTERAEGAGYVAACRREGHLPLFLFFCGERTLSWPPEPGKKLSVKLIMAGKTCHGYRDDPGRALV